jgi:hypothetical protein
MVSLIGVILAVHEANKNKPINFLYYQQWPNYSGGGEGSCRGCEYKANLKVPKVVKYMSTPLPPPTNTQVWLAPDYR